MSASPEEFVFDRIPTPIGDVLIGVDREGRLRVLDFDDFEARMRLLLRRQYGPDAVRLVEGRAPLSIRAPIEAYFVGDLAAIETIPIRAAGTAFQREVWAALRTIPAGSTMSYGGLARQIGRPAAVRAVGLANGANPIGVVVPCHRVIGADASLTGYGGGVERKRWLLAHEGVAVRDPAPRPRRQTELAL
jgi:methylated-DNA-[protein]-cysteine S-methyltransferase